MTGTLQEAINAAVKATQVARALRFETEGSLSQMIGPMDHEQRTHMLELFEISSAINEMESGLRILQALACDPLIAATPADTTPRYGFWEDKPIIMPSGFELVREGDEVPRDYLQYVVLATGNSGWSWGVRDSKPPLIAKLYEFESGNTYIAYARKVAP